MTGRIYRDVILEQHVRLFRGAMGAEFLFMDDRARPHRANIVDECLQSENITRIDWPAYSPDLNPIEHVYSVIPRLTRIWSYAIFKSRRFTFCLRGEKVGEIEEFAYLTRQVNLEVYSVDVQELLDFHNQELVIDELIEMHEQKQDMEEV
ncbi:DDE_3 domain-containing protein [Trichonephila clavipes]|nr:DDE_3 domain-containing protein [Trichonephila clavipes]